jgi:hypothetical protein
MSGFQLASDALPTIFQRPSNGVCVPTPHTPMGVGTGRPLEGGPTAVAFHRQAFLPSAGPSLPRPALGDVAHEAPRVRGDIGACADVLDAGATGATGGSLRSSCHGAETYNAVMKASGDAESARATYAAATAAAYEILMKPSAFAARVERTRFALHPAFVPGSARP